ncbi:hypothetical protein HZC32_03700 [Candidatus Woesearchaeota archaeon]|nr:hypothetical protein [Candidatus Woesearchaeota archaeon]
MEEERKEEYAHVLFELLPKKEDEFRKFAYFVLSQAASHWTHFSIDIHQRYYCTPAREELACQWLMEITPFCAAFALSSPGEKRKVTDEGIKLLEELVEKYLGFT